MRVSTPLRLLGLLFLGTIGSAAGQVATSSVQQTPSPAAQGQVSINQSTLEAFQQGQRVLFQQRQALVAQGATQQQLAAWQQQNAGAIGQQQQQLAQALAATSYLQSRPANRQPNIPPNALPELKNFLTTRAALANARAKIHNQLVQQANASNATLTFAQTSQIEQEEVQLFQQQNAGQLALLAKQSQALANASTQGLIKTPRPLVIPSNASPQMAAYLTQRYELTREQIQVMNQYVNATPAAREAARQSWEDQHASQLANLRQLAQALSQADSGSTN